MNSSFVTCCSNSTTSYSSSSSSSTTTSPDDFDFLRLIGQGSTSQVWLVRSRLDGQLAALKAIRLNPSNPNSPTTTTTTTTTYSISMNDNHNNNLLSSSNTTNTSSSSTKSLLSTDSRLDLTKAIISELRALDRLKNDSMGSPFTIALVETFSTPNHVYFLLDYSSGGDLFQHINRHGPISESRSKVYVAEIGCGLDHLHELGIIFRDLKTENILIGSDGHLKLTDFGLASINPCPTYHLPPPPSPPPLAPYRHHHHHHHNPHLHPHPSKFLRHRHHHFHPRVRRRSICGTPHIIAPEIIRQEDYDHRVDWYSLGSCMFEMLTGHPPFHQLSNDLDAMIYSIAHVRIKLPKYLSSDSKELLTRLLSKDPKTRIGSLEDLFDSNWFSCLSLEDVRARKIQPEFIPSNPLQQPLPAPPPPPNSSSSSSFFDRRRSTLPSILHPPSSPSATSSNSGVGLSPHHSAQHLQPLGIV